MWPGSVLRFSPIVIASPRPPRAGMSLKKALLFPGNANLPIGLPKRANQEIGVPRGGRLPRQIQDFLSSTCSSTSRPSERVSSSWGCPLCTGLAALCTEFPALCTGLPFSPNMAVVNLRVSEPDNTPVQRRAAQWSNVCCNRWLDICEVSPIFRQGPAQFKMARGRPPGSP